VVGAASLGCRGKREAAPSAAAGTAGAAGLTTTASGAAAAKGADGCLTQPDYLVPPQKYGDNDLVRALLVDGDQLFFRNLSQLMKVPLAGGPVTTIGKAPALSLRGTTELFRSGSDLLMQSPGEPIFMKSSKTGGAWTTFIDLTAAKRGGGRDAATRILQGLGGARTPSASAAAFDGQAFYYALITQGKGKDAPSTSMLESEPLSGGEPKKLLEMQGEISEVTRVGNQVAFHVVLPPTAEQLKKAAEDRKTHKFALGVSGENWIMAVPAAGGEAKKLMRLSSVFSGGLLGTSTILGADGDKLYLSGYADEDFAKPGIFRLDVAGTGPEQLEKRFVRGKAYVSGDQVVIVGSGSASAGGNPALTTHGPLVLSGARNGKSLQQLACVGGAMQLHASAVAGDFALLSLFGSDTRLASIAKLRLR